MISAHQGKKMSRAGCKRGKEQNACRVLMRKPEGKDHLEDIGVGNDIILKWFAKE
jgi:hypothetical protein